MLNIIRLKMLRFRDDYKIVLIMTVLAIAFTYVFTLSQNETNYKTNIGVVNESESEYAAQIIESIDDSNEFIVINSNYDEIKEMIKSMDLSLAIYFDEDFSAEDNEIKLISAIETIDVIQAENSLRNIITSMSVKDNAVKGIILALGSDVLVDEELIKSSYDNYYSNWKTYGIKVTESQKSIWDGFDYLKHLIIGFTIMFSMYTMIFSMADILTDKKNLTFQRTIISPISKTNFVLGNLISTMLIAFVQMTVILMLGQYLFGVNWGRNFYAVLIVVFSFIFTVTTLGLLLSNLVRTMGQLGAVTPIIITATSMIGGCMWPIELVNSKILLKMADFTPQRWAILGIKNVTMFDMPVSSIVQPVLILLGMGTLFLVGSIFLLGKVEMSFNS